MLRPSPLINDYSHYDFFKCDDFSISKINVIETQLLT